MQTQYHVAETSQWNPPKAVVDHIVQHAIRNIPNNQTLLDKITPPPAQNTLMGLKPYEMNDTGMLQFGIQH